MACDLLDFRCIFLNEIFGSLVLTLIFISILFLIFASKIRLGYDTTIVMFVIVICIGALAFGNISVIMAFVGVAVAFAVAILFNKLIGNN